MKEKFIKAFEPTMVVKVENLGSGEKEAFHVLREIIKLLTVDYFHITDSTNKTIYLKKKGGKK